MSAAAALDPMLGQFLNSSYAVQLIPDPDNGHKPTQLGFTIEQASSKSLSGARIVKMVGETPCWVLLRIDVASGGGASFQSFADCWRQEQDRMLARGEDYNPIVAPKFALLKWTPLSKVVAGRRIIDAKVGGTRKTRLWDLC